MSACLAVYGNSAYVNDIRIERLKTAKPYPKGICHNKAGRIVLKGYVDGKRAKLYEAANADHARFVEAVSCNKDIGCYFPTVHAAKEQWVMTQWVHGKRMRKKDGKRLAQMAQLLADLHHVSAASLPASHFDYWNNYLFPRFLKATALLKERKIAEDIQDAVGRKWIRNPVVMHPDATWTNTVVDNNNRLMVIDNELLTTGGIPLLDICNQCHSLSPHCARIVASAYLNLTAKRGESLSDDTPAILNMAWLARLAGSAYVKGKIALVHTLVDQYKKGTCLLPEGVQLALKERLMEPATAHARAMRCQKQSRETAIAKD